MPYPQYTPEEAAQRGEVIYELRIRARVEPTHRGQFVVIDIDTGDYELDVDDLAATKRALSKRPGAVLYGLCIGSPATYRLGSSVMVPQP
jgi:hypothetical protein